MSWIVHRFGQTLVVIAGVLVITYALAVFGPGDPLMAREGEWGINPVLLQQLRAMYGLDQPFSVQLWRYLQNLVHGDLGVSLAYIPGRPVAEIIRASLGPSFQLGAAAVAVVAMLGIPLGTLAALKRNSWLDRIIVGLSATLPTVPVFVLAPLCLLLFVLRLGWISRSYGWGGSVFDERAILPVMLLAVGPLLVVVRQTRAGMLEALAQDYIRTARAKGVPWFRVVGKHALRNAVTPVVTVLGLITGGLVTGSLFVENIFGIPGLGGVTFMALRTYDYPLIMGCTLVGTLFVVLANLFVDLLYGVLDPRVRAR